MSVPRPLQDQLLQQARHLAKRETGKPAQASVRRAVSSAYYALFHLLVAESSARIVGATADKRALRHALGRAYQHRQMAEVCKRFSRGLGGLPPYLSNLPEAAGLPAAIQSVASAFVELQEQRHLADYNLAESFTRPDALRLISMTEVAFRDWNSARNHPAADLFLLLLLVGDGMKPR